MRYLVASIVVIMIGSMLAALQADARTEIIKWERLDPFYADGFTVIQRTDTWIQFTVTPEHHYWIDAEGNRHEWGNGVRHQPAVVASESPYSELLEIPWAGCVRISATLMTAAKDLDGDGIKEPPFKSDTSAEIIRGECLDPAPGPIAVPEPANVVLIAAGIASISAMRRRRNRRARQ